MDRGKNFFFPLFLSLMYTEVDLERVSSHRKQMQISIENIFPKNMLKVLDITLGEDAILIQVNRWGVAKW